MNRDYTIKPAVSEGRASYDYGHTRLSQDEPHVWTGHYRWALGVACMIGAGVVAVILAAVAGGWL